MNFVILTQYYPPEVGAPQTRLSELAQRMVQRGIAVTVLTAMPNYPTGKIYPGYGGLLRRERLNGVNVIRAFIYPTQKADFVRRLANYFSFVLSSAILGSFLLRKTDYLLIESPPLFLGLAGLWLSGLKDARMIFNVSDLWPESAVRLGILREQGMAYRLSEWLESFCYRRAWLVTGQSKSILASIEERFPECPTFHLSNGVDTQRFDPDKYVRVSPATGNGDCIVMYAGLHGLAQGLDQVLSAASTLQGRSDCRFVFVGDGPEKERLVRQAEDYGLTNVRFRDPLPAHEMPALLSTADVVLVPLKAYLPGAVPSKLYEAMASSRPIVLVASGEAAKIVRQYEVGITVEPGDVEGLAQALLRLSDDPSLRRTLGANGRRASQQNFDRTAIAERFINFLERQP